MHAHAPVPVLRSRIVRRSNDPSEATLEVLERQIETTEPIMPDEQLPVITADTASNEMEPVVRHVLAGLEARRAKGAALHPRCAA